MAPEGGTEGRRIRERKGEEIRQHLVRAGVDRRSAQAKIYGRARHSNQIISGGIHDGDSTAAISKVDAVVPGVVPDFVSADRTAVKRIGHIGKHPAAARVQDGSATSHHALARKESQFGRTTTLAR